MAKAKAQKRTGPKKPTRKGWKRYVVVRRLMAQGDVVCKLDGDKKVQLQHKQIIPVGTNVELDPKAASTAKWARLGCIK